MEKRIFTAVIVSIAFLWLWAALAPRLFPDLVKQQRQETVAKKPSPAAAPAARTTIPPASTTSTSAATATAARGNDDVKPAALASATVVQQVTQTTIESPEFIAVFSNRGAQLVSFKLKHYQTKPKSGSMVDLVKARDGSRTDYPFAFETRDAALTERLNSSLYEVRDETRNGAGALEYRYVGPDGVAATKTFRFTNEYLFHFAVGVSPAVPYRVVIGPGISTLDPGMKDNQFTVTGNAVIQRDNSLDIIKREKSDRMNAFDNADFVGVEDNYFLAALKPEKSSGAVVRATEFGSGKDKRRDMYAGLNSTGDGVVSGTAFFGPKQTSIIDRYGFGRTLQFGWFDVIARFFLVTLEWINRWTKNWGWSIIVLTILIKMVLYPLQHKWMLSMKNIQRVQPKMEAIKQKYRKHRTDPEQRQKMNTEMMKLYQQEGINPAGGCFPMLIQFPIFIGFYNLLSHAIELRHAPFMLWIQDLSAKDPYYITPILMTAAMFVQQLITPTTADPMQRRMFLIMPIVFGWIFKEFPSGLVLYWLVQNILTIVQQMLMNRYGKTHPAEPEKA